MKRTPEQQKAYHELMTNMLAALKAGSLQEFDNDSIERFYIFAWEREYLAREQLDMGQGEAGYFDWVQEILRVIKSEMAARGLSPTKFAYQPRQSWWRRLWG